MSAAQPSAGAETAPAINGVPLLFGMNIDSDEAAREYRERTVAPYRGVLSADEIASLEERPAEFAVPGANVAPPTGVTDLSTLIDELGRSEHGLVMAMGKGGVGKTTIAAAIYRVADSEGQQPVRLRQLRFP